MIQADSSNALIGDVSCHQRQCHCSNGFMNTIINDFGLLRITTFAARILRIGAVKYWISDVGATVSEDE